MNAISTNSYIDSLGQAQPIGATGGNNELGQEAFLKLMTAQLQQQDPFNPMDQTQMVAQMAQFSSVAGIAEMNVSLQQIAGSLGTSRLSDAANFIGRSVMIPGETAMADLNGSYHGEMQLLAPAENVTVEWLNGDGQTVHSQKFSDLPKGSQSLRFDARNEAGDPVDLGPLTMKVSGGAAQLSRWLPVISVESAGAGKPPLLVTPMGSLPADQATRIG